MLCAKQMNRKQSNTGGKKKITKKAKKKKKKQRSLLKYSASFRPENKFLKAGFPASACCSPQNVRAAEGWEEYVAE